jgi:hypothetical protein
MYTYNFLDLHCNEEQIMNIAGKMRGLLSAQRYIAQAKGESPRLSQLKLDGSQDDQAGKASPCYRRPRISKLLKGGHQAQVH